MVEEEKNGQNEACELIKKEIQSKKKDVVVVFIQKECPYCKMAEKYLMEEMEIPKTLIDNLPDTFTFVDVAECGDYGFEVDSTPYAIRVVNGKVVGEVKGFDKEGLFWLMTMETHKDKKDSGAEQGEESVSG